MLEFGEQNVGRVAGDRFSRGTAERAAGTEERNSAKKGLTLESAAAIFPDPYGGHSSVG